MKQTKAPSKTPSPDLGDSKPRNKSEIRVGGSGSASSVFITMALDMTWRLAAAILIPIIGGFELDQHFDMSPTWTIIGFVVAMAGMAFVLWQTLQAANQIEVPKVAAKSKAKTTSKAKTSKKKAKK